MMSYSSLFRRVHGHIDELYVNKADQRNLFLMINPELEERRISQIMSICDTLYPFLYALDDIIDKTAQRGGRATANALFGGDMTYLTSLVALTELIRNVDAVDRPIVVDCVQNFAMAMIATIELRNLNHCPSLDQWWEVKSGFGACYRACGRLVFPDGRADEMMTQWNTYTALCSDFNSLWNDRYQAFKGRWCEDLENGEYTFPSIWAIEHAPSPSAAEELQSLIRSRPTDSDTKQEILRRLVESGAPTECIRRIRTIVNAYPQFEDVYRFFRA